MQNFHKPVVEESNEQKSMCFLKIAPKFQLCKWKLERVKSVLQEFESGLGSIISLIFTLLL